jgi:hypothetical protein
MGVGAAAGIAERRSMLGHWKADDELYYWYPSAEHVQRSEGGCPLPAWETTVFIVPTCGFSYALGLIIVAKDAQTAAELVRLLMDECFPPHLRRRRRWWHLRGPEEVPGQIDHWEMSDEALVQQNVDSGLCEPVVAMPSAPINPANAPREQGEQADGDA